MHNERFAQLRLAAALGYHLPAASLEIITESGERRLVADVSNPAADLHPGELRDLVGHALEVGHSSDLIDALELAAPGRISVRLNVAPPMLTDCGAGLYSVCPTAGHGTLLFATLLDAHGADAAIRDSQTAPTAPISAGPLPATLTVDDVLAVTVVGFAWDDSIAFAAHGPVLEFARSALSACAVAEQFPVTSA